MISTIFQTISGLLNIDIFHDDEIVNHVVIVGTHTFMIIWLLYDALTLQLSSHLSIVFAAVLCYYGFYITVVFIFMSGIWLRSSRILANLVSWALTNKAFHGHPIKIERLYLRFDNTERVFRVEVDAENVIFGNPYVFVHSGFVYASKLRLRVSVGYPSISKLYSYFRYGATKTEPLGLQEANHAPYYGIINIEILEIENVHVRFELCNGKLNTIELGKSLAQRELIAHHGINTKEFPNCVQIQVKRARGLRAKNPLINLKLRQQKHSTSTHLGVSNPAWDEKFEFWCDDPNGLIDLEVMSENVFENLFVGQYFMSLRFLIWDGPIDGWVRLLDENYKPLEGAEIDISIRWIHKKNYQKPKVMKALSALEMMDLLGQEDEKKSHGWALWRECPIIFKLSRLTLREINISIRDLFTGHHGAEEKLYVGQEGDFSRDLAKKLLWNSNYTNLEATESVQCEDCKPHKVTIVELTNVKSRYNEDGHLNAKELLDGLVQNLIYKVLNSRNLLGSAFVDVFSGYGKNVVHKVSNFIHGETHVLSKVVNAMQKMSEEIENETHIIGSHLGYALHTRHAAEDAGAEDDDLFKPEIMSTLLEKRNAHGIFHPWTERLFTLKGKTIFYKSYKKRLRKINVKHVKYCTIEYGVALGHKKEHLSPNKLRKPENISPLKKSHLVLNLEFYNGQVMSLRLPKNKNIHDDALTGTKAGKERVTLLDWKTAIDKIRRFHHHNNVLKQAVKGMGGMNFVKKINELHKQAEEEKRAQEKKALEELRELRPKRKGHASIVDRFDNLQKLAKNTSPDKQRGRVVKIK
jgi:hypothetical protein